jgi:hypothetical protein
LGHQFSPDVVFEGMVKFRYVVFENGEKVELSAKDLSNVSFLNTDVTHVKFSDDVIWSGEDKFTVMMISLKILDTVGQDVSLRHLYNLINNDALSRQTVGLVREIPIA